MHKLKQLVHHGFQKFPVSLEESRVLANNVHDVARNHSFVVLSALHLGETQEILDHSDEETLFRLLVHSSRYGTNCPAQGVAVGPRPLSPIDLFGKFVGHDAFGVDNVEMCKIDKAFSRRLVELNGVTFLHKLSDDFSLVVFDNQDLLRANHFFDHDGSQTRQHFLIFVLAQRIVGEGARVRRTTVGDSTNTHTDQRVDVSDG